MQKKEVYKQIGRNIARIRKEKGLTQEDFAELMDKSWSYVAKLETGAQNFSVGKLIDIAEYLNVDYKTFLN